MERPQQSRIDWQPGSGTVLVWNVLGILLVIFGIALFATVYAATHGGGAGGEVRVSALVFCGIVFVALLPLHEWIHGVVAKRFGAQPEYGVGVFFRVLPYLYCTAPGHRFTRGQFAVVSASPVGTISAVGMLLVAFAPSGGWLVVPLGLHLGGCIGDLWMLGLIYVQPSGSLIEDAKSGVSIFPPPA